MKVVPSIAATRLCYEMIIGTPSSAASQLHILLLVNILSIYEPYFDQRPKLCLPQPKPQVKCAHSCYYICRSVGNRRRQAI